MAWTDIITAFLAIYGAILSTVNLIIRQQENISKVNVGIRVGFEYDQALRLTSETMIFLEAANVGKKSVTLASYFFEVPGNKTVHFLTTPRRDVNFPYELSSGKSCQIWTELKSFAKQLKHEGYNGEIELVGTFKDQVGKTYKSKPYFFNVDEWSKQNG